MNTADAVDLIFMALTIWREARGESSLTKIAVGYSILNRVRNPKWWGTTVQDVVTKAWQYSSLTDPHDPQLTKWPKSTDTPWLDSLAAAACVLSASPMTPNPAPGADSYFDLSIAAPVWARPQDFIAQLDHLRFYNVDRDHEVVPV